MFGSHAIIFREAGFRPASPDYMAQDCTDENLKKDRSLVCRTCSHSITRMEDGIAMNGKQIHALFNPAGILFEVGCFATAPGCSFEGMLTHEFSWFAGYAWRYAFCRQCGTHLGWEYRGEVGGFVGLVMSELREG